MRRAYVPIAAVGALVLCGATAAFAQDCPPGTKKTGEDKRETATQIIIRPICQRMTAAEMRARVEQLDQRIKDVRQQLVIWRRDHLPQIRGEIEMWEQLSREAQTEFYISAGNLVLSKVITDELVKARGLGPMGEDLKGEFASFSERYLRGKTTDAAEARDKIAGLGHKLRNASRVEHALEVADAGRELAVRGASWNLSHDARSRMMTAGMGIVYVATQAKHVDPRVHLMFSAAEFGAAVFFQHATLAIGREQVDQLSTVAGQQVAAVTKLSTLYKQSFEERAALRAKLGQP